LLNSDIASSKEEIMVLLLSRNLGIREALDIAADFNWMLSARFYAALSNSARLQT
jgi:hypothetical protein